MDSPNERRVEMHKSNKNIHWIFFFRQLFSCSAVVMNYFIVGIYMGAPTVIIPQLRKEANSTDAVTPEVASWLSSVSVWCTLPWVFILPMLAYRFGRKLCLILISLNVLLGNVFFYCSTSITELIFSLVIQGVLFGSMLTIGVMVTSEYTSPKYRGIFMTMKSATLYWGVWVSNAIGTFFHWKNIGIVVFICLINNLTTIFYKESPYWLASKGRFDECIHAHRWLKGTDEDSEKELKKLISSQKEHLQKKNELKVQNKVKKYLKTLSILRHRSFYKPLMLSLLPMLLYVLSGKVACTVYAIEILKKITQTERMAYQGMLILDGVTVVGMYLGCALSKVVTRRKQMLVFSSVGIGFLYILSIYLYLIKADVISEHWYASLFFLVGFSISISCGTMILAPCCVAEMAPLSNRSYFLCLLSLCKNVFLAITLKFTPFIFKICGTHGAFLFYSISSTIALIVLKIYLPETKDQTIQEIEDLISGANTHEKTSLKNETVPLQGPA